MNMGLGLVRGGEAGGGGSAGGSPGRRAPATPSRLGSALDSADERAAVRCSWGASPRTAGRERFPRSDPCSYPLGCEVRPCQRRASLLG